MSNDQIKQILSMGYRGAEVGIKNKLWLKPFGNAMFRIKEQKHEVRIDMIFKNFQKELMVWDHVVYKNNVFNIDNIKEFENNQLERLTTCQLSEFQFLTVKEIYENDLIK